MFSYVFMKILELRPRSYDRWMDRSGRGRVLAAKRAVAAEIEPGAHVLEIGCGTGELAAMLVAGGASVNGFDLNPGMVAATRERIEAGNLGDRLTVRRMGVDGMDSLPDRSYDAVVSTLVFSELTGDERRFALGHAFRTLRPGGRLVIADEVLPRSGGGRFLHAISRAPVLAATYLISRKSTRPLADLPGEAAAAGFVVEKEIRSRGDAFALLTARKPVARAES